ncbi:MAG: hypothetical protein ACYC42_07470 [Lysobacter sp.]
MISQRRFQSPALLLAFAALAGCVHTTASPVAVPGASQSGDVGVTDITALGAPSGRLVLAENETFFLPLPQADNALPAYPQPLLARRLPPQAVCLEIGIDAEGDVMTALPIVQAPDCPADDPGMQAVVDRRFFDAAADAVLRWRFDAAFRCEYPNDAARIRQDCSGGRETPQAVSLAYRFIFEQRDGRGSVRQSGDAE